MEKDCIFCKIIKGEIPSYKIYEDKKVFAFLDINPINSGHTLIVPKKHFKNIFDLEEEIAKHMICVAKKISLALKKIGADGVIISMNNGEAAGQAVLHVHIHIIPRFEGDGLTSWPTKKMGEKELKEITNKIILAL